MINGRFDSNPIDNQMCHYMAPIVYGKEGSQGKHAFVILHAGSFAAISKTIFKYQIIMIHYVCIF